MWRNLKRDEQKPYRLGYPNQSDDESENTMLRFYKGEIPSKPHGDFIDSIHEKWFGDYAHLEIHHGYIQWIFPIREEGVNFSAPRLHKHEVLAFRADATIRARVIRSYEMMLDFYGMKLIDADTGEVARNPDTYKSRYAHLNSSFHNYLRISRILKALGEFGFERFKMHWIELFIEEIFVHGNLRNTLSSLKGFWVPTLRQSQERIACKNKIHGYLKEADTDDEGDDMGSNPDMKDLPSPQMSSLVLSTMSAAGSADTSDDSSAPSSSNHAPRRGSDDEGDDADDELTDSQDGDDSSTNLTSDTDTQPKKAQHAEHHIPPTSSTTSMSDSSETASKKLTLPTSSTAPAPHINLRASASNRSSEANTQTPSTDADAIASSLANLSLANNGLAGSSSEDSSDLSASEDTGDDRASTTKEPTKD